MADMWLNANLAEACLDSGGVSPVVAPSVSFAASAEPEDEDCDLCSKRAMSEDEDCVLEEMPVDDATTRDLKASLILYNSAVNLRFLLCQYL